MWIFYTGIIEVYMKDFVLDEQLGFNLYRTALLFRRELIRCLSDYNMTPEQWQLLASLWRQGELRQVDIAKITLQDAPSISRMIKRMEAHGWIEKTTDVNDSRSTIIKTRPAGQELKKVLPKKLLKHFEEFLKDFPEKEQALLTRKLLGLRAAIGDFES